MGEAGLAEWGSFHDRSRRGTRNSTPESSQAPSSALTDSSLCRFDVDPTTSGEQFLLIFTSKSGAFQLTASNPGQFYDNVFFVVPYYVELQ